jgi:hypothetical protein
VVLWVTCSFEIECNTASTEIGLKFCSNIDMGRLACGILNYQKQFGHYFYDMAGLKYKVALSFDTLRGQTSRYNVGLTS